MERKVNDFVLLNQAIVYYVSNTGHKTIGKKADLKRRVLNYLQNKIYYEWILIETKC